MSDAASGSQAAEQSVAVDTNSDIDQAMLTYPDVGPAREAPPTPVFASCFAVGLDGVVLGTRNAGASWSSQNLGAGAGLSSITCSSAAICEAAGGFGSYLIFGTTDGGLSWTVQHH